jgi:hypothetical protein
MTHFHLPVQRVAAGHPKNKISLMEKTSGLANAAVYDYGVLYPDRNGRELFYHYLNSDDLLVRQAQHL